MNRPATALILVNYKANVVLGPDTVSIEISFMCGGKHL